MSSANKRDVTCHPLIVDTSLTLVTFWHPVHENQKQEWKQDIPLTEYETNLKPFQLTTECRPNSKCGGCARIIVVVRKYSQVILHISLFTLGCGFYVRGWFSFGFSLSASLWQARLLGIWHCCLGIRNKIHFSGWMSNLQYQAQYLIAQITKLMSLCKSPL